MGMPRPERKPDSPLYQKLKKAELIVGILIVVWIVGMVIWSWRR
jgi:hypothetical protein